MGLQRNPNRTRGYEEQGQSPNDDRKIEELKPFQSVEEYDERKANI